MNFTLASKTLAAFEHFVKIDQGAAWRQHLGRVMPHLDDAYRGKDEGFRTHLGASLIGRECGRELWYGFHWSSKSIHEGRMLRLFNRGHMEEGRFIALLLTIGCEVYQQDANGKQFRISEFGGHFGGSGDGVAIGIPDFAPGVASLLEFKTHNDKSFAKLVKEGVRAAKFEHWVQMQVYMRKMGLTHAVYFAINKNDDHIHAEIVYLDSATADRFIERAGTIIRLHQAPAMINKSPGWYGCNFCDFKPICKLGKPVERNCRTCAYSEPSVEDGSWRCTNPIDRCVLSKADQLAGCSHYELSPSYK